MTNPLVSIIVPVYNARKGLSRCLESICGQTYQELQIILLNDGSTDDSLAICEQFRARDARIMVVDKENEGVSRTRNAGLALAQGDYIQFADSDDLLDPDYTQNLVQAALQHSADLVIAPYWMVIPSNSSKTGHALETLQTSLGIEPEAPKTEVHKYGFLPQGVYSREDYARRLMQQPASFYYGVLWNKLYRREIIAQNQLGFAPDVHWAEDLIFNMGYLEHAQVFVSIPEAGYHYIQNPKSICHTQIDLRGIVENKIQVFQLFKKVYTRLGLYEELQPQIYKFLFAFSESGVPSDSLQGALLDAMSRLNDASVQPEPSRKKPRRKPKKHARRSHRAAGRQARHRQDLRPDGCGVRRASERDQALRRDRRPREPHLPDGPRAHPASEDRASRQLQPPPAYRRGAHRAVHQRRDEPDCRARHGGAGLASRQSGALIRHSLLGRRGHVQAARHERHV